MIWLLIGYMWLFVHRPFEVWPWLGSYHIERAYMLLTLVCWTFSDKTWTSCRNNVPTFLLAGVLLFAVQVSPYATFHSVEDWYKVLVFYFLVITLVRTEKDFIALIYSYIAIVFLYELHSLREFLNGRHVWAMGTKRMIGVDVTLSHPNSFGASAVYAMLFLYPAWTFAKFRWQKLSIIGAALLATTCVLQTGSRSAFGGILLVTLAGVLASRHRMKILVALAIGLPALWGSLRIDLQDRYMSIIDPSRGVGFAQKSAEGRTNSFIYGMKSFVKDPIFGSGMGSYKATRGFSTHNLYHQSMGELGISGLAVLLAFAWAFYANYREARYLHEFPHDLEEIFLYRICLAAALACAMFFFLGWGSHSLLRYNWLWFGAFSGIALNFLRQRKRQNSEEENQDVQNVNHGSLLERIS